MAIIFILFLLILAVGFAIFKQIKTCVAILILTLVCFFIMGNGILPNVLLKNLESPSHTVVNPQFGHKRNAIIILGAGVVKIAKTDIYKPGMMAYSRIYEGLQLYQSCKRSGHECTIIISGGDAYSKGASEALVYKNELHKFNVKDSDIQIESQSVNTFKNAEFTSQYLKKQKFEHIFLVTSGIHMMRALLYFSHFGIKAIPISSDYTMARISLVPLGYNFAIMDFVLHEYLGILRYNIYNLFGWNTRASFAGYP